MSKPIIKVQNISKRYRLGLKEKQADTLLGQLTNIIKSPYENYKRLRQLSKFGEEADESVFWALKDINFEVQQGEVLGIIGKNGAGKSTLLKILSQITEPTSGRIEIHGRVASLLEVGTGFHPELSGRENIYMNGTILGMTRREIDRKLDEIIDFSGVEKFIDTPVKFYSSGMKVRLGFSVAAHLDPEILIIDEVLAVGDYEFQQKCLGKMEDVSKNQGRTVLFVSHNIGAVKNLCSKSLCLKSGMVSHYGDTNEIIDQYLDNGRLNNLDFQNRTLVKDTYISGFRALTEFQTGNPIILEVDIYSKYEVSSQFSFTIKTRDFQPVFQVYSNHMGINFNLRKGQNRLRIEIEICPLVQGNYYCSLWLGSNSIVYDFIKEELQISVKEGKLIEEGPVCTFNGYPIISQAKWQLQ